MYRNVSSFDEASFYQGDETRTLWTISILDNDTSDKDLLFYNSERMKAILEPVFANNSEKPSDVRFLLKTTNIDPYGQQSTAIAFLLEVNRKKLRGVKWESFFGSNLLSVAYVEKKNSGVKLAAAYCDQPDNRKYARRFCESMSTGDTQDAL